MGHKGGGGNLINGPFLLHSLHCLHVKGIPFSLCQPFRPYCTIVKVSLLSYSLFICVAKPKTGFQNSRSFNICMNLGHDFIWSFLPFTQFVHPTKHVSAILLIPIPPFFLLGFCEATEEGGGSGREEKTSSRRKGKDPTLASHSGEHRLRDLFFLLLPDVDQGVFRSRTCNVMMVMMMALQEVGFVVANLKRVILC